MFSYKNLNGAAKGAFWALVATVFVCFVSIVTFAVWPKDESDRDPNVLATVGTEKVTVADLNEDIWGINFSGTPENPGKKLTDDEKKRQLDKLIEQRIAYLEAQKLGIKVTEEELEAAISERVGKNFDEYSSQEKNATRKAIKASLLLEKVQFAQMAKIAGKFVIVRFDRAWQDLIENKDTVVASDKEYAKTLVDRLYQEVSSGTKTIEQAMKEADADKVVGMPKWAAPDNYTFSKEFKADAPLTPDSTAFKSTNFAKLAFENVVKDGVSKPAMANTMDDETKKSVDSFYFFFKPTVYTNGYAKYSTWLDDKYKEYNVVKY
jgi:parvulin-like peptidyl-prolyl isomerase